MGSAVYVFLLSEQRRRKELVCVARSVCGSLESREVSRTSIYGSSSRSIPGKSKAAMKSIVLQSIVVISAVMAIATWLDWFSQGHWLYWYPTSNTKAFDSSRNDFFDQSSTADGVQKVTVAQGRERKRHHRRMQTSNTKLALALINADNNQKIVDLTNGIQVALTDESPSWNIQALVVPSLSLGTNNNTTTTTKVQSVVLRHAIGSSSSSSLRSVSSRPSAFRLCHVRLGASWRRQCLAQLKRVGNHTITVTAYDQLLGVGTVLMRLTVSFTVIDKPKCSIPKFVGEWQSVTPSYPLTVAEAQGAMMNNGRDLVLISGFVNGYDQSTAQTYARTAGSNNGNGNNAPWRRMDDVPVAVGITHGAFALNGNNRNVLYMCGGYVGGHPGPDTNICYVYNHSQAPGRQNQWSRLGSDLPSGRAGGGLIFDKQRRALVFAAGAQRPEPGNPEAFDYNTTWMYSFDRPNAGWVRQADIPFLANHMSFVTAVDPNTKQERHYFLGGQVGENEYTGNVVDNFEWDMDRLTWVRRKSMLMTRGHAASSTRAVGCGFVIAAGSTNENGKTADVSYYNIPTDTWTSIGALPNAINTPVCDIDVQERYMYCESGWATGSFSWRRQMAW